MTEPRCRWCGRPRWPTHGKTFGRCLSPDGKVWRTFEPQSVVLDEVAEVTPEQWAFLKERAGIK